MLHRRDAMIRVGQAGLGALSLPGLLQAQQAPPAMKRGATAKSCILVYLWGGPPQQDMWDMKPHAPAGIRSQFEPIDTVVPGIQICDQMPMIARQADKMSIIRSFTHPSNEHAVGVYHTMTGRIDDTLVVDNQRNRRDFPNMGSVVAYHSPTGGLPSSVTIPRPIAHNGVTYTGTYAGFLGSSYDPMELKPPGDVKTPAPHSITLPPGLTEHRLQSRYGLLKTLEMQDRVMQQQSAPLVGHQVFREQAFRMLMAPEAKGALDISREPQKMRDRYGRNEYGEAFLLARRLIEAGVKLVTLVWYYIAPNGKVLPVWDNHGGFESLKHITGYQTLKEPYCLPSLDLGYSALLEDLAQCGMLDDTLVVMLGEFGRTPKINAASGRDHWGACQSVVLAGGGTKGGLIHGATDKIAAYPTRDPVKPEDLIATVYNAMGINPAALIHDQQERPHRLSEGTAVAELF